MTDVVWTRDALIANAESLLAIDAKGALTPHGIGHLAREIITGFLDLVRDADPLPDADGWIKHTPDPVRNFVADGFDAGLRTFRILRDLGATRGRPFSDEYIVMAVLQDAEKAAAETLRLIGEAMEGK